MKRDTIIKLFFAAVFLYILGICSSCMSKKKCIEKYCAQDTVSKTIVVHDTIITKKVQADTVFSTSVDTIILIKDKLTIKYLKIHDSVYLSGEYAQDTIVRIDTVTVEIPVNCPKPTTWDHAKEIWWLILLALISGISVGLYISKKT